MFKRFLTHLHLHPDPGDSVSIMGPPEMMKFIDVEPEPDWDDSGSAEADPDDEQQVSGTWRARRMANSPCGVGVYLALVE